jgi:hypothetical protein
MAITQERALEAYLRDRVQAAGGRAYKFVSPGNAGVPDRLVVFPGGEVCFVELKAPGRKSTKLQTLQQQRLADLGCLVYADVDSRESIDRLVKEMTI